MSKEIARMFGHEPGVVGQPSNLLVYNSLVGVEVELEGVGAVEVREKMSPGQRMVWGIINDGSLRGDNFEAVLRTPLSGRRLVEAISALCGVINARFIDRVEANERTSLHVHVDARDIDNKSLSKLLLMYIIMEKALFNYVGAERISSNYCIPSTNTVDFLTGIRDLYDAEGNLFIDMLGMQDKYAALNLTALSKYGSLEFRHHPGTYNYDRIIEWINILLSIKRWALEIGPDPELFPEYMSAMGPRQLGREVFGRLWHRVDYPMFEEDCYFCIRRVQDIVYSPNLREGSINLLKKLREGAKGHDTPYDMFVKKRGG